MDFDFRPLLRKTFAELSQKYPYRQTPAISRGAQQRKSKHQGRWCLALAKPHFWKLDCCMWSLFLETSESNIRQRQQGCACGKASPLEARPPPMKGKVNVRSTAPHCELNQDQTEILRYPPPAGAQGGREW